MSVEVKQSDREAAASVLPPFVRAEVLAGKHDTAGDCSATVQAFAAHRRQAEEAMRERAAGECLKYRLQCDMIAVQRARDGENGDAAIACSLAAELLERTIRSIDTRGE